MSPEGRLILVIVCFGAFRIVIVDWLDEGSTSRRTSDRLSVDVGDEEMPESEEVGLDLFGLGTKFPGLSAIEGVIRRVET